MNFDQAATWDSPQRIERAKALAKAVLNNWGEKPKTVLDFGCGTGLLTFALNQYADMIYGFDTSDEMKKVFYEKADARPNGECASLIE